MSIIMSAKIELEKWDNIFKIFPRFEIPYYVYLNFHKLPQACFIKHYVLNLNLNVNQKFTR